MARPEAEQPICFTAETVQLSATAVLQTANSTITLLPESAPQASVQPGTI